jgi:hypothetical protein
LYFVVLSTYVNYRGTPRLRSLLFFFNFGEKLMKLRQITASGPDVVGQREKTPAFSHQDSALVAQTGVEKRN